MLTLSFSVFILCLLLPFSDTKKPNFIFYFQDETRAESLGTYGHPITKTPNFDRLAKQGTIFTQNHVLHTQCSPSRCALTTGRYMHTLGHRTQTHLVQAYEPNMFRYLKNANYTVHWYGKNDMLSQDSFPLSVTYWEGEVGVSTGQNAFQFGEKGYYSFLQSPTNVLPNSTENGDYKAIRSAIKFLKSNPPEPFMLFLPTFGSHPPYGAPKGYYDLYDPTEIKEKSPLRPPDNIGKPYYHSKLNGIQYFRELDGFNDEFFYKIQAIYLGRVTYVDYLLGLLMDALDESGLSSSTTLIVSSDHGDFAGDYHLVEKWPGGLDDILTRVPLLIRTPGGVPGHVVNESTQLFDVMATILDLADINVTHVHFAQSLKPQLFGAKGNPDRVVYSEGGFYYYNEIEPHDPLQKDLNDPKNLYYARALEELLPNGSPRAVMARKGQYKLVYRPQEVSEFYDFSVDNRELKNLWNDTSYTSIKQQMLNSLLEWFLLTGDVTPLHEDQRGLPPYPPRG
eukprot:TRINITY_DN8376_c0_g1_i1.p1 TRINITY_DN8376_c0_g1~~TRINITY_DN8376_c0_g1_i1.p1  ORF type:complete len:508 (-),score=74.62 TRINITY_DN8376_c0_g1_i1:70-1593(-)